MLLVAYLHLDQSFLFSSSQSSEGGTQQDIEIAISKNLMASQDDLVIYMLTTYDVWQYANLTLHSLISSN